MAVQHNKKWTVAVILGAVATIAVYAATTMPAAPANAARRTQMTAQQAAEHAAPICRLLVSKPHDLQQLTQELSRIGSDGERHKIWVVDCVDSEGQHIVHTVWDAETGNLILTAHEPQRGMGHNEAAVNARDVAKTAWYWLEALGVSHTAPRWRVARAPQLNHDSWIVVMGSPQYNATVIFDKYTLDLVYLVVKEKPMMGRTF